MQQPEHRASKSLVVIEPLSKEPFSKVKEGSIMIYAYHMVLVPCPEEPRRSDAAVQVM